MGVSEGAFENGAKLDDLVPGLIARFQDRKLVSPQSFEQGSDAEGGPLIDLGESLGGMERDDGAKGPEGGE